MLWIMPFHLSHVAELLAPLTFRAASTIDPVSGGLVGEPPLRCRGLCIGSGGLEAVLGVSLHGLGGGDGDSGTLGEWCSKVGWSDAIWNIRPITIPFCWSSQPWV